MGSSMSVSSDARAVAYALASEKTVAEFFQEEINDVAHRLELDKDVARIETGGTDFWESTSNQISLDPAGASCTLELSLFDLCLFISDQPSLASAGIIACTCYTEPTVVRFIPHEFLILQLRRDGRPDVWLRLDRYRSSDVGLIKFAQTCGITASNDKATLAASRTDLLRSSRAPRKKSSLVLQAPFPLSAFRLRLLEIVAFVDKYKLTSDNCWVFCYLLMSEIVKAGSARFLLGRLCHENLAQRTERQLLAHRFEPIARSLSPEDISRFVPLSLLINGLRPHNPHFRGFEKALEASRRWEESDGFASSAGQLSASNVIPTLSGLDIFIPWDPDSPLAIETSAFCRQIALRAGASWAMLGPDVCNGCVDRLYLHGRRYLEREPPNHEAALPLLETATSLLTPGVTKNRDSCACWLHYYHAVTLHDLGRRREARVVVADFIRCTLHDDQTTDERMRQMKGLYTRGIWPSKFNYHLGLTDRNSSRQEDLVHDQITSQVSIPSPLSELPCTSNPIPHPFTPKLTVHMSTSPSRARCV